MRPLAIAALVAALAACDITNPAPALDLDDLPATVILGLGDQRVVGSSSVRFSAVREDSRCPVDATCIWAGNAQIEVTVSPLAGDGPAQVATLNSFLEPKTASALGLRLSLVGLSPDPRLNRPTSGYRAELRVEIATE